MGRLAKISFKETFQRKNGCKRSFLPCLRLCLCDSCNKPTVPTNNEVPTNQVPTNAPNSPNQVPTNATSYWRISPDNEEPFIRLMKPSFFMTCIPQSMEPLYLTPPPEVIIILLLIVSMG